MKETRETLLNAVVVINPAAVIEKHYKVKELALVLGCSRNTITKLFGGEPDVIRIGNGPKVQLRIPESAVVRVLDRQSAALRVRVGLRNKPLQSSLPSGDPLRVVRLRDLNGGVAEKPRNIIKLHAGKKLPNRERVP